MKRVVAIIGTRHPSPEMRELMVKISRAFRDLGWHLATGNADGVDGLARDVWNETAPERVMLFLPWREYNANRIHPANTVVVYDPSVHHDWTHSVWVYHPAPDRLTPGGIKLHARNYGIVQAADVVIALPNDGVEGGGTGQGIRVARSMNKPLFVLPGDLGRLREFYRQLRHR